MRRESREARTTREPLTVVREGNSGAHELCSILTSALNPPPKDESTCSSSVGGDIVIAELDLSCTSSRNGTAIRLNQIPCTLHKPHESKSKFGIPNDTLGPREQDLLGVLLHLFEELLARHDLVNETHDG